MNKKDYLKPLMKAIEIESCVVLSGSPNPPEWHGEGSAPEFDLDDWEQE